MDAARRGAVVKGCPEPTLPRRFKSTAEFGEAVGWGTFDAAARERAATITREEVQALGLTVKIAQTWLDLYECVARRTPRNPSARGRADLMRRIIELLEPESVRVVREEDIDTLNVPESFKETIRELQALGINMEILEERSGSQTPEQDDDA